MSKNIKSFLAFLLLTLPFLSFTQSLMSKFDSFLNLLRASEMSNISIFWFPLYTNQRFINLNLLGILWKHQLENWCCCFQEKLNYQDNLGGRHLLNKKAFENKSFDNLRCEMRIVYDQRSKISNLQTFESHVSWFCMKAISNFSRLHLIVFDMQIAVRRVSGNF